MAETTPPSFDLNKGIYFPQLTEEFKISQSAAYDYYSTNSGMYPKNPGGGGGGGGGGGLDGRVAKLEEDMKDVQGKQAAQASAAHESMNMLSNSLNGIIPENQIDEIDDLVHNQFVLKRSQENLLSSTF